MVLAKFPSQGLQQIIAGLYAPRLSQHNFRNGSRMLVQQHDRRAHCPQRLRPIRLDQLFQLLVKPCGKPHRENQFQGATKRWRASSTVKMRCPRAVPPLNSSC